MDYIYDGTYHGFLTALFDAYTDPSASIRSTDDQTSFFERKEVMTDSEKEKRIRKYLAKNKCAYDFTCAFLSSEPKKEDYALQFFRLLEVHRENTRHLADAQVIAFQKIVQEVHRERHRFLGITRFQSAEEGEVLVAEIEPKHNVLPLIIQHFEKRMGKQKWMIFDTGRAYAYFWDGEKGEYFDTKGLALQTNDPTAEHWRVFYKAVGIQERKNEALKASNLPKRYWKNLTEMQKE